MRTSKDVAVAIADRIVKDGYGSEFGSDPWIGALHELIMFADSMQHWILLHVKNADLLAPYSRRTGQTLIDAYTAWREQAGVQQYTPTPQKED